VLVVAWRRSCRSGRRRRASTAWSFLRRTPASPRPASSSAWRPTGPSRCRRSWCAASAGSIHCLLIDNIGRIPDGALGTEPNQSEPDRWLWCWWCIALVPAIVSAGAVLLQHRDSDVVIRTPCLLQMTGCFTVTLAYMQKLAGPIVGQSAEAGSRALVHAATSPDMQGTC
jgi:hypothetical protein